MCVYGNLPIKCHPMATTRISEMTDKWVPLCFALSSVPFQLYSIQELPEA